MRSHTTARAPTSRALTTAACVMLACNGGEEPQDAPASSRTTPDATRAELFGRATIDGQPFTALSSESACMIMGSESSGAPQFVFTIADASTQIQFRTPAVQTPGAVRPHGVMAMRSDSPFSQMLTGNLHFTEIERSPDGYFVSGTFAFDIREMEMMGFTASGNPPTTMHITDGEFRRVECLSATGFTFPDLP